MKEKKKEKRKLWWRGGVILVILLLLCLLFHRCSLYVHRGAQLPPYIAGEDWDGRFQSSNTTHATGEIAIPGYPSLRVDNENDRVKLINPVGNEVLLRYRILHNDAEIYSSDFIKPNGMIYWPVLESLQAPGTYHLTFCIDAIRKEDRTPCSSTTQKVALTLTGN